MSTLTHTDIQGFEQQLNERRQALRRILRAVLIESLRSDHPTFGRDVHDVGEESFAELTLGVDLAAHAREIQELKDLDDALKRIALGSFGCCIDCGNDIERRRLVIYPTAKRCLRCQQRHEAKRSGGVDMSPSL